MAKQRQVARQKRREAVVARYAAHRNAPFAAGDYAGLAQLPRDASPIRLKHRCAVTGRLHGYLHAFGVSRITFREMALRGELAGVRKASW